MTRNVDVLKMEKGLLFMAELKRQKLGDVAIREK